MRFLGFIWVLLVVVERFAELGSVGPGHPARGGRMVEDGAGSPAATGHSTGHPTRHPLGRRALNRAEVPGPAGLKRGMREAKAGGVKRRVPLSPRGMDDPSGYFTTPRTGHYSATTMRNSSAGSGLLNPLFPVSDGSYWAYTVMLLALVLFSTGVVGNLALMCIVWHNLYLKSAWNCILAGLALWNFVVVFFCLPMVVFHQLTSTRPLGELSCGLVPYLEVTSQGVATFSLCALSIDRFHAATDPGRLQMLKVEPCQSILSKLSVIWLGSLVLAAPELLLYQLMQEPVSLPAREDLLVVDICVSEPSVALPEGVLSVVLTYQEARMWWMFGCYLCLPLLFTLACDMVTRQVLSHRSSSSSASSSTTKRKQYSREHWMRSTIMALTILYVACNLPEIVCNIALSYISVPVPDMFPVAALPAVSLISQFLLFVRCSVTPVLLLCVCRSLGQAFMDCCCCCCDECFSDTTSSSASTTATPTISKLPSPLCPPPPSEETMTSMSRETNVAFGTPC
uniref:G protein-coupled receptor 37 like 1a n=1 Tax=Sphaeramia orbicularis TaxID=375764 RepID=A0A672YH47_9TELE